VAELSPSARIFLGQARSHAFGLEAVAQDLEHAGLSAIATRAQVLSIRSMADKFEAAEQARLSKEEKK